MDGGGAGFGPQTGLLGNGADIPFFRLRMEMEAKWIAFLLDHSGSMSGPFRKTLETELEHSLQWLLPGTQI